MCSVMLNLFMLTTRFRDACVTETGGVGLKQDSIFLDFGRTNISLTEDTPAPGAFITEPYIFPVSHDFGQKIVSIYRRHSERLPV